MRLIVLVFILVTLSNGQSRAADCPEFFRFVDFGLQTSDGTVRGGPTYRAEGLNGRPLLIRELSVCSTLRDLATDGHGIPIPVVTRIEYNPDIIGIDLTALSLMASGDIAFKTEQNAADHRARLKNQAAMIVRGSHYLCAGFEARNDISCQLVSPFGSNLALVVYCDLLECRMPSVALNEMVIAAATWPSPLAL